MGCRKNKNIYEGYIKKKDLSQNLFDRVNSEIWGDKEECVIYKNENKIVTQIIMDITESLISGIAHGFLPVEEVINILRCYGDDIINKIENLFSIRLDDNILWAIRENEEKKYIEERVNEYIKKKKLDLLLLSNKPSIVITKEILTTDYPKVPNERMPITGLGDGLPEKSGIYFIWGQNIDIVYVGQSINLNNRVRFNHENIKEGDWVSYLLIPISELNFAECYYIGICKPKRNFGCRSRLNLESISEKVQ